MRTNIDIDDDLLNEILRKTKNTVNGLIRLECNPYEAAIGAAGIYRNLRQKGITI